MTPGDEEGDDPFETVIAPTLQKTVDASDSRKNQKRESELELQQREIDEFWRGVFATAVGRRAMWHILDQAHAFQVQFAASPTGFPDQAATWFHAGEQDFGYRLFLTWLKIDRANVLTMLEEHDVRLQPEPMKPRQKSRTNPR